MNLHHLEELEASGKYVFHGSGYEIEKFEPRQAYNFRNEEHIPDGEPAIWASPYFRYALFMAVINDANCPDGFHSGAGSHTGTLRFRATQKTLDQLNPESKGYVYVFNKSEFTKRDENEYFSLQARRPVERVEVRYADFDMPVEVSG